jgi:hypothetical protein
LREGEDREQQGADDQKPGNAKHFQNISLRQTVVSENDVRSGGDAEHE